MPGAYHIARDVQRAIYALLGFAVLCVILAALYRNPYLFQDPAGKGLPDINVGARTLVVCFQVGAATALFWSALLSVSGTPVWARALQPGWRRWTSRGRSAVPGAIVLAAGYATARLAANGETLHATLEMLTAGTADLPFQYRALIPGLARLITTAVPSMPLYVAYGMFEGVAALGLYVAFRYFLRPFVTDPRGRGLAALAVFLPLALTYATPYRYNAIYFPYDTPSVAFFTLGLALMMKREWRWYYPLFLLATLNRETTCFLTIAYALTALRRDQVREIVLHVGLQAALWVASKAGLHWVYLGNAVQQHAGGGLFYDQLARSARILTTVPGLIYIAVIAFGGAGVVVALLWRRVEDLRLRALFGIVPLFFGGMIVVGELLEVRIYGELIPIVTAAVILIVRSVVSESASQPEVCEAREGVLA